MEFNFNYRNGGLSPSFLFIVLLLIPLNLLAQDSDSGSIQTFSGIVVDADSNEPIEYVSVFLSGSIFGTVTNKYGEFLLKVPSNTFVDKLSFSSIGFESRLIKLIEGEGFLNQISLNPSAYMLSEVTVSSSQFDSGEYILKKGIESIKFNYPIKSHLMEGFFRELSLKDTMYTRLIEAAVRIQEVGYNKNTYDNNSLEMTKNRVKVIELRKSDDFRESDLLTKALNLVFGDRNELYEILNKNYVRVLGKKSNHILSEENIKKLDLEYIGRTELENQIVYILSLKDVSAKSFQWNEIILYINQSDFAFVKIERKSIANPDRKDIKEKWLIDGKYFSTSEIIYRKIGNRYFPFFINAKHSASDASAFVNEGDKILKQYIDVQFLLTNVYEDDYSRIKWRNAEERDKDLYENDTPYNNEFWEHYNTVKLNPLKRDTKDLEKKKSLIDQFKRN